MDAMAFVTETSRSNVAAPGRRQRTHLLITIACPFVVLALALAGVVLADPTPDWPSWPILLMLAVAVGAMWEAHAVYLRTGDRPVHRFIGNLLRLAVPATLLGAVIMPTCLLPGAEYYALGNARMLTWSISQAVRWVYREERTLSPANLAEVRSMIERGRTHQEGRALKILQVGPDGNVLMAAGRRDTWGVMDINFKPGLNLSGEPVLLPSCRGSKGAGVQWCASFNRRWAEEGKTR